jgi:membrane-associated phospholipid phosphatase
MSVPARPTAVPRRPQAVGVGLVLVALAAILVAFGTLAIGVREQQVFVLDTWATPFLHGIASRPLDIVMNALTTLGSAIVIVPAAVVAFLGLAWRHRPGAALFLGVATLASALLNEAMKAVIQRPRPVLPWADVIPEYSFPSGHTMNSLVFYLALALVAWSILGRRAGLVASAAAVVLAAGVGISRIYLGHHYLTDVVGGLLAGGAVLLVAGSAVRARPAWDALWRGRTTSAIEAPVAAETPETPGRR